MPETTDPQPDRSLRAVLTVTVETRPDGGHYFDQADFTAHATEWVRAALKGQHAVDEVTVVDQAAELARAQAEAHQYRTALQGVARAAVPSAPADRAAILRELAASIQSGSVQFNTEAAEAALKNGGPFALIAYVQLAIGEHLRRMAVEAPAPNRAGGETQGPRCDVEFVSGDQCTKRAGHWTPKTQDPHTPGPVDKQPEPVVVAYRNPDRPSVLLCRQHGDGWWGLAPLAADDLPDGGTCTYGDPADPDDVCGVDVLIPQQPTA